MKSKKIKKDRVNKEAASAGLDIDLNKELQKCSQMPTQVKLFKEYEYNNEKYKVNDYIQVKNSKSTN